MENMAIFPFVPFPPNDFARFQVKFSETAAVSIKCYDSPYLSLVKGETFLDGFICIFFIASSTKKRREAAKKSVFLWPGH